MTPDPRMSHTGLPLDDHVMVVRRVGYSDAMLIFQVNDEPVWVDFYHIRAADRRQIEARARTEDDFTHGPYTIERLD